MRLVVHFDGNGRNVVHMDDVNHKVDFLINEIEGIKYKPMKRYLEINDLLTRDIGTIFVNKSLNNDYTINMREIIRYVSHIKNS